MFWKITILVTLFSFTIGIPCAVLAQDATVGATRKEKVVEKMATREAALKKKLDAFRDKRRAEVVQRVNDNLNQINKKQTSQMLKHLDKMSTLLNKLEKRVNDKSPDIKDTAAAKTAIADAKSAIDSATSAVSAQAEKDYTITVTSEAKVKTDAQKVRESLRTDLKAVRQLVIDAKKSVAAAIRTAKSGKVGVPKEGTTSGRE